MVFIAALLAVVWFVVNKIKRVRAKANPGGLPFSPVGRFLEVQYAFASKDAGVLRALLGKDLVDQILANLPEGEPRQQTIWAVHYNVVDVSTNAISIIYTAEDSADNTTLQETWHYVPSGAAWVLNGIEVNKQDALYLAKAL